MALCASLAAQQPAPSERAVDRGIGVVDFTTLPDSMHVADTIVFHGSPRAGRAEQPIARLIRTSDHGNDVRLRLVGVPPLEPNLLEYGYEIVGVPYDSVSADGRWARALLGTDSAGTMQRGWVALEAEHVVSFTWRELIPEQSVVYPLDRATAAFAGAPGGRVQPALTRQFGTGEYELQVLERQGPWLKVRFITVDQMCGEPLSDEGTFTIAWIRYLDPAGRPLVWYYTRGC